MIANNQGISGAGGNSSFGDAAAGVRLFSNNASNTGHQRYRPWLRRLGRYHRRNDNWASWRRRRRRHCNHRGILSVKASEYAFPLLDRRRGPNLLGILIIQFGIKEFQTVQIGLIRGPLLAYEKRAR